MKKIYFMIVLALTLTSLSSCYRVQPNGGEEAVLTYKPYLFGHGGVDPAPVQTGAEWCVWTTESQLYTITPLTLTEEFSNMIPSDNTPISFAVYLRIQVISGKTPYLHQHFGVEWYKNNLQAPFRTMVRDKACVFKMFDLASKREISEQLEKEIFKEITDFCVKIGLPISVVQVSIGAITPPEQVLTETKLTAAQNQSILTQGARAKAEDARAAAETKKAIADKAYQSSMGMTIAEYLHLRQLEIEKEKVELIKDHTNVTIIFGGIPATLPVETGSGVRAPAAPKKVSTPDTTNGAHK